jgi:hypothetical protein
VDQTATIKLYLNGGATAHATTTITIPNSDSFISLIEGVTMSRWGGTGANSSFFSGFIKLFNKSPTIYIRKDIRKKTFNDSFVSQI